MRLLGLIFLLVLSPLAQAETLSPDRLSTTISYPITAETEQLLETVDPDIMPALKQSGFREEGVISAQSLLVSACACDVSIFDVSTILISDFDHNGFYHRFKLVIDADTAPGLGRWVYAKLYLSFEGGPWNEYATSGDFFIEGDVSSDEFVVETELVDGYPTGYYDIKIELFDAEFGDWLLDYGPYDDNSLSAVPLEDRERDDDDYYYGYVSGGSTQLGFLAGLIFLGLLRAYSLTGKPAFIQPRKPSA